MVREVEGSHSVGTIELYTKTWKPSITPVAKMIVVHGFNDHVDRYYELFPTLASRGIEVHGFDQRGWGRSVQKPIDKGLTGPTNTVLDDIASVVSSQLPSSVPIFIFGHSMGGGEALCFACDPAHAKLVENVRGWLLESPFIAFPAGQEPNFMTVFFGRLVGKLIPHKKRLSALPPENLSRDPEVVRSLKEDPLLHGMGTLEGLAGMLDRVADLSSGNLKPTKGVRSIWFGHGTEDYGTSYAASKKWFDDRCHDVEDKEFKTYDGWYHQLHADLPENRQVFAKDIGDWILSRVESQSKL